MRFILISSLLFELGFSFTSAIADDSVVASEETQIIKMAHEKTYPGGRDEDDLEVQNQKPKPIRKMGGNSDNIDSSSSDDEF